MIPGILIFIKFLIKKKILNIKEKSERKEKKNGMNSEPAKINQ